MISVPPSLASAYQSQVATTCLLLDLNLVDSSGASAPAYYTTFHLPVTYNSIRYTPHPFEVSEFSATISSEVDTLSLSFDNASLLPVSLFLNTEQRGKEAVLYFCALDDRGNAIGAFEVFRGFINSIRFFERERSSVAEIQITHELALWKKETLRPHSYKCPWRFKDSNCGYTGGATWCDKTYERCRALQNTANFGGFPHLQDIVGKEVWWGRKP